MSDPLAEEINALRKAGRFEEAAQRMLAAGRPEDAAPLFAEVWKWQEAIAAAEAAEQHAKAYAYALEAGDRKALARLLQLLPDHPEQAVEAAIFAESKGRVVDAARLREASGDVTSAAALFAAAGELGEAARCHESAGQYREAGMLYERRVAEDPTDGDAALRLGRILAHFGRYEHAVRALQRAEEDESTRLSALEWMIAGFDALGMNDAAAECLDRLRRLEPSTPVRVADFLTEAFGDERGLAGLAKGGEATQLLAGRYRIVRTLGAGGSGRVLLAHDGFYDRDVAVKILNVASGARGRDAYARFAKEARVAAGIDHPNVVRVHEFNPDGPFLVMEFMAGGTLEDRLPKPNAEGASERLPLAIVRHVADGVLRGLEAVHRRGVIHRDLKPANVFFGETGDVKLGDFGVAHLQDLSTTLTGALMGTLAYMAPEQVTGRAKPEAGTDLYAFGIILQRMLTGALPFTGPDFVSQHLESVPPTISSVRPELGPRFDEVLQQLLAKELKDRPTGVESVRTALDSIDWGDPEDDALRSLMDQAGVKPTQEVVARPESAPVPANATRYVLVEARENGAYLAEDTLLERAVRVEPCDAARAAFLKRLAAADHPHLQAIFDIDVDNGRAVLEEPAGETLGRAALDQAARARSAIEIRGALESLHRAKHAHGALSMTAIRVGAGRAVLMLPAGANDGTEAADLERLTTLFE